MQCCASSRVVTSTSNESQQMERTQLRWCCPTTHNPHCLRCVRTYRMCVEVTGMTATAQQFRVPTLAQDCWKMHVSNTAPTPVPVLMSAVSLQHLAGRMLPTQDKLHQHSHSNTNSNSPRPTPHSADHRPPNASVPKHTSIGGLSTSPSTNTTSSRLVRSRAQWHLLLGLRAGLLWAPLLLGALLLCAGTTISSAGVFAEGRGVLEGSGPDALFLGLGLVLVGHIRLCDGPAVQFSAVQGSTAFSVTVIVTLHGSWLCPHGRHMPW